MNNINIYASKGICFRVTFDDKPLEGELDNKAFIDLNIENIILYIEDTYRLSQFSHYTYDDVSDLAYLYYSNVEESSDVLITSIENKEGIPELHPGEYLYLTQNIADAMNELDRLGSGSFIEGDEVYIRDKSKSLVVNSDINYYLITELVEDCKDNISITDIINYISQKEENTQKQTVFLDGVSNI